MPDIQNTAAGFSRRVAARRAEGPGVETGGASAASLSGSEWLGTTRNRRAYFAYSALILIPALGFFGFLDAVGGHWRDSLAGWIFVTFLLIALVFSRKAIGMTWLVRLGAGVALVLIGYETYAGLNEGVTFVWFFTVPITVFFLVGDREGAFWAVASIIVSSTLLVGVPGGYAYAPDVSLIFILTFSTVCLLAFLLESNRRRLAQHLERESEALREAVEQVEKLQNLMPICARCKSVRDDRGYWHEIESYLLGHTEADLESAFCPDCASDDINSVA